DAGRRGVPARQLEHLVGHVHAERTPERPDAPRREEHVDAAAGAEVEDDLALAELRDRQRVAAAEAHGDCRLRQALALLVRVERGAEGGLRGGAAGRVAVTPAPARARAFAPARAARIRGER